MGIDLLIDNHVGSWRWMVVWEFWLVDSLVAGGIFVWKQPGLHACHGD